MAPGREDRSLAAVVPVPAEWLYVTPFALGNLLRYVGERYGKPETWVMEFGTGINGESTWTGDQVITSK